MYVPPARREACLPRTWTCEIVRVLGPGIHSPPQPDLVGGHDLLVHLHFDPAFKVVAGRHQGVDILLLCAKGGPFQEPRGVDSVAPQGTPGRSGVGRQDVAVFGILGVDGWIGNGDRPSCLVDGRDAGRADDLGVTPNGIDAGEWPGGDLPGPAVVRTGDGDRTSEGAIGKSLAEGEGAEPSRTGGRKEGDAATGIEVGKDNSGRSRGGAGHGAFGGGLLEEAAGLGGKNSRAEEEDEERSKQHFAVVRCEYCSTRRSSREGSKEAT